MIFGHVYRTDSADAAESVEIPIATVSLALDREEIDSKELYLLCPASPIMST